MKNTKILFILIPIVIVVLVLASVGIYIELNNTAEKIFKKSISKAFDAFETTEEQYSTMKGTMSFTANVDSDEESMQSLNTMLEGASIDINMEADWKNIVLNNNVNVMYDNENLLNATLVLQDQTGYIYMPDWLDKYLELSSDLLGYSDLTGLFESTDTLDNDAIIKALKDELITAITNQNLTQEKTTLTLNGKTANVKASKLNLKDAQISEFFRSIINNLSKNENFKNALGTSQKDILEVLNEMSQEIETAEDMELTLVIYTKGLLNEFVGISGNVIDNTWEQTSGVEVLKHDDGKYEFVAYDEEDSKREELLKVMFEDKKENKNKGTATITITVDEEQYVVLYNYEIKGKQTIFTLSTEIEGVKLSITGNTVENGNNVKGELVISVQDETMGKVNLNYKYDFTYGVEVKKVDIKNAVSIDEISDSDMETLTKNLQDSVVYQLIEEMGLLGDSQYNDNPEVTYGEYTVEYDVPDEFEVSEFSSESHKIYTDENYNTVNIEISYDDVDTYMRDLEDAYELTSDFYKNQKITEIKTYTVNGTTYKNRIITYNDSFDMYVNLYFAYELDNKHCYIVEISSENGNISRSDMEKFLDITVNTDDTVIVDGDWSELYY